MNLPFQRARHTVRPAARPNGTKNPRMMPCGDRVKLLLHAGDFGSEIVLALFETFALLIAAVANDFNIAAQLLGGLLGVLLDREVAVFDERLLEEAVFLVELVELAGRDLFLDLLRLGGHLRVVVHLSHQNGALLVENVLRHIALVAEARVERGDLHGDVLAVGLEFGLGCDGGISVELHDNGMSAAGMYIADQNTFKILEATDLDILADGKDLLAQLVGNGAASRPAGKQSIDIGGGRCR